MEPVLYPIHKFLIVVGVGAIVYALYRITMRYWPALWGEDPFHGYEIVRFKSDKEVS